MHVRHPAGNQLIDPVRSQRCNVQGKRKRGRMNNRIVGALQIRVPCLPVRYLFVLEVSECSYRFDGEEEEEEEEEDGEWAATQLKDCLTRSPLTL